MGNVVFPLAQKHCGGQRSIAPVLFSFVKSTTVLNNTEVLISNMDDSYTIYWPKKMYVKTNNYIKLNIYMCVHVSDTK